MLFFTHVLRRNLSNGRKLLAPLPIVPCVGFEASDVLIWRFKTSIHEFYSLPFNESTE